MSMTVFLEQHMVAYIIIAVILMVSCLALRLKMVKEEGKWLVSMSKEDLNKEEEMEENLDAFEAEMDEEVPAIDSSAEMKDY